MLFRSDGIKVLFVSLALLCLWPTVPGGLALALGLGFSFWLGNPYPAQTRLAMQKLLQISIIGLGAGMNLSVIGKVGLQGVGYTAMGLALTFIFGTFLGKLLNTEKETSALLTVGTAICGGSAIAAVASAIHAKPQAVSVSLVTVFILNAVALFIFPGIGHFFDLDQVQFGLWSALAIHDTSSVVGASLQYGAQAMEVATTVKLARALWIIPISILFGILWHRKSTQADAKPKRPWFILGFLIASAVVTWVPELRPMGEVVSTLAKRTLVLTLFLIGSSLNRETLKGVGIRPLIQGVSLWIAMAGATLGAIMIGWIRA